MVILSNFYILVGTLLVVVLVLQAESYSLTKKLVILLALSCVLIWLEKPDWLAMWLQRIRYGW